MSRKVRGSQKWLRILVNCCPELLNDQILSRLNPPANEICWRSPLKDDGYVEYKDKAFIESLKISLDEMPLECFWPQSGPRWDGLGVTDKEEVLLVEAKAHVRELCSPMRACNEISINRIKDSMSETREFMRAEKRADWTRPFYQYANHLAHLYFLHVLNKVNAYLVNVYFMKDEDMKKDDTIVPQTREEWESAILTQEIALGIPTRHGLRDRVVSVFIDVEDIKQSATGC